ncbi:MAG: cytochrome c family protein [Pseudomonadota bacterium]
MRTVTIAALAALAPGFATASDLAAGDAEAGEKVFRKCQACHVVDEEKNRVGPHLVGVIGRQAGSIDGFRYSKAFEELDFEWTEERLADYLADPRGYVKGTKMAFAGLRKEEDVADVIAYLRAAE